MEIKDLAPWIAVAITLALSILIPLFTQIVNNRFQLKQKELENKEKAQEEKRKAFFDFTEKVGACLGVADNAAMKAACGAISKVYLFYPKEKWNDLDELMQELGAYHYQTAKTLLIKINKTIADVLSK